MIVLFPELLKAPPAILKGHELTPCTPVVACDIRTLLVPLLFVPIPTLFAVLITTAGAPVPDCNANLLVLLKIVSFTAEPVDNCPAIVTMLKSLLATPLK